MNANECNGRANQCADNAGLARAEWIALEFLTLAAQWRVLALRESFIGQIGDQAVRADALESEASIVR